MPTRARGVDERGDDSVVDGDVLAGVEAREIGRERGGRGGAGRRDAEVEQSIVSGDVQSKRADDDEGGTSVADDDVVDGGGEGCFAGGVQGSVDGEEGGVRGQSAEHHPRGATGVVGVARGGEDGGVVRVRVRVRDIRGAVKLDLVFDDRGAVGGDEAEERAHARARDVARAHDETIADGGEGVPAFQSEGDHLVRGEGPGTVDGTAASEISVERARRGVTSRAPRAPALVRSARVVDATLARVARRRKFSGR